MDSVPGTWRALANWGRYWRLRRSNGTDARLWDDAIRAYHEEGRLEAVEELTRALVARGLEVREGVVRTLAVMRAQGRLGEAREFFAGLPAPIRQDSGVERELAAVCFEAGDFDKAHELAEGAHQKDPADAGAFGVLLLSKCGQGRCLEALRSIDAAGDSALDCDWAIKAVFAKLATLIEAGLDEWRADAEFIERLAERLADRSAALVPALARLYRSRGDNQKAADLLYRLLGETDSPAWVRWEICQLALETRRWHEHIEVIKSAASEPDVPEWLLPHLRDIVAWHAALVRFYRNKPPVTMDYRVPDSTFEMAFLETAVEPYGQCRLDVALIGATLGAGGAENVLCNAYLGMRRSQGLRRELWVYSLDSTRGDDFFLKELDLKMAPRGECFELNTDRAPEPPFSWLPFGMGQNASAVYKAVQEKRPWAVHAWQDSTNLEVAFAAVHAGVPQIVVHPHNMQPDLVHGTEIAPSFRRAYRALLQRPNVHLVCVSEASLEDYLRWLEIERGERHHVVYNGFEWPAPLSDAEVRRQRLALRREFGLDESGLVVGGMFRVVAIKRPKLWLDVARAMVETDDRITFMLFGDGPDLPALRGEVERLGLGERIRLAGTVRQAASKCGVFDILLHTSSSEGLPTVLLEAQARGIPVVASNAGGVAEALDGALSLAVESSDVDRLAGAIRQIAGREPSHHDRETLMRFVRERFGVDRMLGELERIYGLERCAHRTRPVGA